MNFFQQGIPLGRWFGITVVIHWTFLLYIAFELFSGGKQTALELEVHALEMGLLFATVLTHEFGHALSCKAMGGKAIHIVLWPLGGIAFIQPPGNAWAWLVTTVCGPLVNAVLWPVFWFLCMQLNLTDAPAVENYFNGHPGAAGWLGLAYFFMWQINKALLLFNLIPSYPMDGGRILQEILWMTVGFERSLEIAGVVGTIAGIAFIVLGIGVLPFSVSWFGIQLGGQNGNYMLSVIGFLCATRSWGIFQRARMLREQNAAQPPATGP